VSPAPNDLQQKIQIIRECLGGRFQDVRAHNLQQERFFFHDGKQRFQFGFFRPVMEDFPLDRLRNYMESDVIPMIVQNPGLQTYLGTDGLSVRERVQN